MTLSVCIMVRANKGHHTLALKDFQDQNFENILNRPAFCWKPGHEKKELEFLCNSCEIAICYSCVATVHDNHPKILLDEAANERKLHIKAGIESRNQIALQKKDEISRIQANCVNIQAQVDCVKKDAQMFVDSMIDALEAKKKDIFHDLEKKATKLSTYTGSSTAWSGKSSTCSRDWDSNRESWTTFKTKNKCWDYKVGHQHNLSKRIQW